VVRVGGEGGGGKEMNGGGGGGGGEEEEEEEEDIWRRREYRNSSLSTMHSWSRHVLIKATLYLRGGADKINLETGLVASRYDSSRPHGRLPTRMREIGTYTHA